MTSRPNFGKMKSLLQTLRKNFCFETNTAKIVDILTKQKNDNQSINQWFICNSPNAQKHNIKFQWQKGNYNRSIETESCEGTLRSSSQAASYFIQK